MRRDGAVTGNSVLIALEMLQDEAWVWVHSLK